jgi:hypothetical protein
VSKGNFNGDAILSVVVRMKLDVNVDAYICEPPANRERCIPKEALMSDWKNASQGLGVGFKCGLVRVVSQNP